MWKEDPFLAVVLICSMWIFFGLGAMLYYQGG